MTIKIKRIFMRLIFIFSVILGFVYGTIVLTTDIIAPVWNFIAVIVLAVTALTLVKIKWSQETH